MRVLDLHGPGPARDARTQAATVAQAHAETQAAEALCLNGRFTEALAYLDRAVHAEPENALHYANRALANHAIGTVAGFATAIKDGRRAVELAPAWPRAYYRYGLGLRAARKFASADAALRKGLELAQKRLTDSPEVGALRGSGGFGSASGRPGSIDDDEPRSHLGYRSMDPYDAATAVIGEFSIAIEETLKMADGEGGVRHVPAGAAGSSSGAAAGSSGANGSARSGTTPAPSSSIVQLIDLGDDTLQGDEAAEGDVFQQLESWLAEGSTFPYLYMRRYGPGSRGVHARCDVPAETELLAVGQEYLITVEMSRACPIGRKIAGAGIERDLSAAKHCYLTAFVLWDRQNPASFFQPYYRILPSSYPNMPIFWSDEELSWLRGSYVLQQIADRKANIRADYELICKHAPEMRQYSLGDFSWGRMMVASRNFGIVVDGCRTDALVPYADMLNHYRPRQTRWAFDNRKRAFVITSLQTIHGGQQVFDSYGKKCNSRFLLNYGFAVDNNVDEDIGQSHNEVRLILSMEPTEEDPHHSRRLEVASGLLLEQFQPLQAPGALDGAGPTEAGDRAAGSVTASSAAAPGRSASADRSGATAGSSATGSAGTGYAGNGLSTSPGRSAGKSLSRSLAALDIAERPSGVPGGGGAGAGSGADGTTTGTGSDGTGAASGRYISGNIPGNEFDGTIVRRGTIVGRAVRVSTYYDSDSTTEAFSWLRLLHATPSELAGIPKMEDDSDLTRRPIRPLSCANEASVLRHLAQACAAQLGAYPTTYEQDVADIESGRWPLYSNKRNALILLRGEKEVCRHYMRLSQEAGQYLSGSLSRLSHADARSNILRSYSSTGDVDRYMRNVVLPLLKRQEEGLSPAGPVGPTGVAPPPVPVPSSTRAHFGGL